MARLSPPGILKRATCRDRAGLVRMAVIKELARQIAERFQPEQIRLFGSYAYGTPEPDSYVDLLVIMEASISRYAPG